MQRQRMTGGRPSVVAESQKKTVRGPAPGTRKGPASPRPARPQHHLAGLYLDEVLCEMMTVVSGASDPLEAMMRFTAELPPNLQCDLLCSFIREFRKLVTATAIREIADNI